MWTEEERELAWGLYKEASNDTSLPWHSFEGLDEETQQRWLRVARGELLARRPPLVHESAPWRDALNGLAARAREAEAHIDAILERLGPLGGRLHRCGLHIEDLDKGVARFERWIEGEAAGPTNEVDRRIREQDRRLEVLRGRVDNAMELLRMVERMQSEFARLGTFQAQLTALSQSVQALTVAGEPAECPTCAQPLEPQS